MMHTVFKDTFFLYKSLLLDNTCMMVSSTSLTPAYVQGSQVQKTMISNSTQPSYVYLIQHSQAVKRELSSKK